MQLVIERDQYVPNTIMGGVTVYRCYRLDISQLWTDAYVGLDPKKPSPTASTIRVNVQPIKLLHDLVALHNAQFEGHFENICVFSERVQCVLGWDYRDVDYDWTEIDKKFAEVLGRYADMPIEIVYPEPAVS